MCFLLQPYSINFETQILMKKPERENSNIFKFLEYLSMEKMPEFKDDCLSIASSVSSNKSSKSFRSRLRERFVFSNSNSEEVGHKALEIDLENKNLKIENLEKELDFKNKEIKERELEKNGLLNGILELNNEMFKLKTKLAENEIELSQIKAHKLDQEEISCIKNLLQSEKESIIQSCMEMYDSKGPGLISDGIFSLLPSSKEMSELLVVHTNPF